MISIARTRKGFSLLEVLIGLIFLALGLLAVASMQITSTKGGFFSSNLMQATYAGQDRMEFLKNVAFTDAALSNGTHADGTVRVPDIPGGVVLNRSYIVTTVPDPNGSYLKIDYYVAWSDGTPHGICFTTVRCQ